MINLKGFKPIPVYGCASASTMTITDKYFKFNGDTAKELGTPKYIQILVNSNEKKVAVAACDENAEGAVAISCENNEEGRRYVINFQHKAAHTTIRNLMGWEDKQSRRMAGISIPEGKAIVYDLQQAKLIGQSAK